MTIFYVRDTEISNSVKYEILSKTRYPKKFILNHLSICLT